MHTMDKDNCLNIGFFQKPHGVFGTLMLNFREGMEELVEHTSVFLVEMEGILVPWFTIEEGVRIISAKTALVDLDWIEDEESAKKLTGKNVWIEHTGMPQDIGAGDEPIWTGYRIYDNQSTYVGEVTEVNDYSGNLVFTVNISQGELLLPFHVNLLKKHDKKNKILILDLPEGLFDL